MGFCCQRRMFMEVQFALSAARDQEPWRQWASMIKILWQALARSPGWKCCWRLQDCSTLVVMHHRAWFPAKTGETAPGTADASIHSSGSKMLPSRSCYLPLRLGQAEAISLPVDAALQSRSSVTKLKEGANRNLVKFSSDKVLHLGRKSPLHQYRGGGFFKVAIAWRLARHRSASGVWLLLHQFFSFFYFFFFCFTY